MANNKDTEIHIHHFMYLPHFWVSPLPLVKKMKEKEEWRNTKEGEKKDPIFADVIEV